MEKGKTVMTEGSEETKTRTSLQTCFTVKDKVKVIETNMSHA